MESKIIQSLAEITVSSAIIYCMVMLFKKAFRRAISPFLQYALWFILILRLILPVTFDLGFSFIQIEAPQITAVEAPAQKQPQYPQKSLQYNYNAISSNNAVTAYASPKTQVKPANTNAAINEQSETVARDINLTWQQWLIIAWAAGMIICSAKLAISGIRLKRRLNSAQVSTSSLVRHVLLDCRRRMGIKQRISVITVTGVCTPALTLSVRPKIIIPQEMSARDNERELYFALIHELTHYKRKDYLCCLLWQALQIAYWFNPFVYLAAKATRLDMESACDASVIRNMEPLAITDYAKALIKLSSGARLNYALGMGLDSAYKTVEKRIRGIYMIKKSKKGVKAAAMIMAAVIGAACFTTACQPSQVKDATPVDSGAVQTFNIEENKPQSAKEPDAKTAAKYQAPRNWQDTYTEGDITLNVNAEVELPKDSGFATATAQRMNFTQAQVDALVDYFAKGSRLFQLPQLMPKSQAEDWLSELKKERSIETDTNTIAELDRQIAAIEKYLKTAEENPGLKYVDSTLTYGSSSIDGMYDDGEKNFLFVGIEGAGNQDYSFVEQNSEWIALRNAGSSAIPQGNATRFEYSDGAMFIYEPSFLGPYAQASPIINDLQGASDSLSAGEVDETNLAEEINPVDWAKIAQSTSMTEAQAKEAAQNTLKELNIEGLTLSKIGRTAFYDADGNPTIGGYALEYVREIDGVPCSGWLSYSYLSEGGSSIWMGYDTEGITIVLNEDGVHSFEWLYPTNITDIEPLKTELLPFEDVKKAVSQQIIRQLKRDMTAKNLKVGGDITSINFDLTDIGLYEAYNTSQTNGDKFPVVPAWVCIVNVSWTYEDGNEIVDYPHIYKINAIDGKMFDSEAELDAQDWQRVVDSMNASNTYGAMDNANPASRVALPTVEEYAVWRQDNRLKYAFSVYNPNKDMTVKSPSVKIVAYDKEGNVISDEVISGQYILPESYWYCARDSAQKVAKEPAKVEVSYVNGEGSELVKLSDIQNVAQDVKIELDIADKTGLYGNGIFPKGEKARPVTVVALYRDGSGALKGGTSFVLNSTLEDGITAPFEIVYDGNEKYVTENVELHVQPW